MYTPKHFQPYELVPKFVYESEEDKGEILGLFDENALRCLDLVREWAGVGLTVNNWYWGGTRQYSGFRPKDCKVGATNSAHKTGKNRKACAFDIISPKITTKQLWALIDKNADKLPCKIRIERTSGGKPIAWLHIDTAAAPNQNVKIYYFNA